MLAGAVLAHLPEGEVVRVVMDDHATLHKGPHVYGKARHRDPVRGSQAHTVWLYGHKRVHPEAICVKFPFASRAWALPVLCGMYRDAPQNQKGGRRHKTPLGIARGLMATLCRWFPDRRFEFIGDPRGRGVLVTRGGGLRTPPRPADEVRGQAGQGREPLRPAPGLPPPRQPGQRGRPRISPRVEGDKLPPPRDTIEGTTPTRAVVAWYGGGQSCVELFSGVGHWYRSGRGRAGGWRRCGGCGSATWTAPPGAATSASSAATCR